MKYVYILSDYEEHAAEHVVGTLDRGRLAALMSETWKETEGEKIVLASLLESDDEALSAPFEEHGRRPDQGAMGHLLSDGWGGIQLHVVRLS